MVEPDATLLDRIRGCLIGGAVGDALGAPVEFWSLDEIWAAVGRDGVLDYLPSTFHGISGPGLITDDTQMTLFSVEGLIRMLTRTDTQGIATTAIEVQRAYWRWYDTQVGPFDPQVQDGWLRTEQWLYSRRAPGRTCLTALQASRSQDPFLGGTLGNLAAQNNSKGCGTVMRAAPFGFLPLDETGIWEISGEAAAFTHGHRTAQHAAGALSLLIWHLAHGVPLDHAVDRVLSFVAEAAGAHETVAAIVGAVAAARSLPVSAETVESLGEGWVAQEALAIAIYAGLVYPEPHQVREALALSVTHSGDSDSTGSICGNILGAAHGVTVIPADLIGVVEGRSTILKLADELWGALSQSGDPGSISVLI